jgi:DNA-directed RNA polymerase specialized sigma24 family protein
LSSAEPNLRAANFPRDEATVLALILIEGMTYREAATAMGRSPQDTLITIRRALHRARRVFEGD